MMYCYFVEFDFVDGDSFSCWHDEPDYADVYYWAKHILEQHGGGHADIFDDEGELAGDVEV